MTRSETDVGERAARGQSPPRSREESEFDRFLAARVKEAAEANLWLLKNTRLSDLDDVQQEVHLAAWTNEDSLSVLPREQVRTWIFRVARNITVSMFRRTSIRTAADIDEEVGRHLAAPEAIDHELLLVALYRALTGFADAGDRQVGETCYRHYILGSSVTDLAAGRNVKPDAVRKQMERFMKKNAATLQCALAEFADATC